MNGEYMKILSCYEDFKLHKGELFGEEGFLIIGHPQVFTVM